MHELKSKGIIHELESGDNFGYVLNESKYFGITDYKVLQSQNNGIFVPCMKMMYNGKIQLFYITEDVRPMSTMLSGITIDTFINIVVNLFGNVEEVRNNGFLQGQNIDISGDKIFVEENTLKVKLVYLPINVKAYDSYNEFESQLRTNIIRIIDKEFKVVSEKLNKFVSDLRNNTMSIEDIYNKYQGATGALRPQYNMSSFNTCNNAVLKLVALNNNEKFEVALDKEQLVIGKKQGLVDIVIGFNKMISRKHCSIYNSNGNYYISDEGSANGTYVNGVKVSSGQRVPIKKGDIIRMADSDFQLV